jgi:hypothetical protein
MILGPFLYVSLGLNLDDSLLCEIESIWPSNTGPMEVGYSGPLPSPLQVDVGEKRGTSLRRKLVGN